MTGIDNDALIEAFDRGEDVTDYMLPATARHPNEGRAARRISMDVPEEMVRGLDRAAARMGVNRQAVIKVWLSERLDQEAERELTRA